jgi:hypothetical protein
LEGELFTSTSFIDVIETGVFAFELPETLPVVTVDVQVYKVLDIEDVS